MCTAHAFPGILTTYNAKQILQKNPCFSKMLTVALCSRPMLKIDSRAWLVTEGIKDPLKGGHVAKGHQHVVHYYLAKVNPRLAPSGTEPDVRLHHFVGHMAPSTS